VARQGKAAITVCSTAFLTLGRAQARALGNGALPIAVIPHPFGGRKREEVRKIAGQCADDIARLLSGAA
jgi:predicted dienelactone hydrolase